MTRGWPPRFPPHSDPRCEHCVLSRCRSLAGAQRETRHSARVTHHPYRARTAGHVARVSWVTHVRAVSAPRTVPAPPETSPRIASIDLIRGAVMILMAIDHVRVYAGVPAGGPTAGVFFTRWITHFVAPAFIFLAGTSAFFYSKKHSDLSRFLLRRGVWLVLLELTVIRVAWTFNFDFKNYMLAGVIWVIGWCMVIMAALVKLRPKTVGIIGAAIIAV